MVSMICPLFIHFFVCRIVYDVFRRKTGSLILRLGTSNTRGSYLSSFQTCDVQRLMYGFIGPRSSFNVSSCQLLSGIDFWGRNCVRRARRRGGNRARAVSAIRFSRTSYPSSLHF